jgi:hypothetical protein
MFDDFITLTTKLPFTNARNILRAQEMIKKFTAKLRYETDSAVKYFWGMDVTDENRLIHYHILTKGPLPSHNWTRKKWYELSRCYRIDFRPAGEFHKPYILGKVSSLPNIHDDARFKLTDIFALNNFRRIGHSKGLFLPPPPKTKSEYSYDGMMYADMAADIEAADRIEWTTFGSKAE